MSIELRNKWVFFSDLLRLQLFDYERCLKPKNVVGSPVLVLLSNASDVAYGFSAYVRWRLVDFSFWCCLVMSKSRIVLVRKIATLQMELNAVVLSFRGHKLVKKETRFEFEAVHHLVDSETVSRMLNKVSTRLKVYEGVRVGEIHSATNGDMSSWSWIKVRKMWQIG